MRIFLALLEVYDAADRDDWGEDLFWFWCLNTFREFDYSAYYECISFVSCSRCSFSPFVSQLQGISLVQYLLHVLLVTLILTERDFAVLVT